MSESKTSEEPSAPIFNFDLTAYSTNYHGNALYARLRFIANRFPSRSSEAYDLLSSALKSGCNSALYSSIFSNRPDFDRGWVDETERKNHLRLERLEADFSAAKASLVKESIRTAYTALGHHHNDVGNLQEAMRAFTRTRDYTSMPRHTEEMMVNVCTLAVDLQRPHILSNFLTNSNSGPSISNQGDEFSTTSRDKLRALGALLCLSQGDFANAARRFASVESPLVGSVLSGEDVALGAVLCGMAGLGRVELQNLLLESPRFKTVLDLVPALRELLGHFLSGRCKEVKVALGLHLPLTADEEGGMAATVMTRHNEVRTRLELDLHLQPHAAKLLDILRDKLVLQYFRPYNAIRLSRAVGDLYPGAETCSVEQLKAQQEDLESHLWKLIESGQLQARIDAGGCCGAQEQESAEEAARGIAGWNSTLRRVQRDERAATLQEVWTVAHNSAQKTKQSILRLSLMKHSFSLSRGVHHLPQHGHGEEDIGTGAVMMDMDL